MCCTDAGGRPLYVGGGYSERHHTASLKFVPSDYRWSNRLIKLHKLNFTGIPAPTPTEIQVFCVEYHRPVPSCHANISSPPNLARIYTPYITSHIEAMSSHRLPWTPKEESSLTLIRGKSPRSTIAEVTEEFNRQNKNIRSLNSVRNRLRILGLSKKPMVGIDRIIYPATSRGLGLPDRSKGSSNTS